MPATTPPAAPPSGLPRRLLLVGAAAGVAGAVSAASASPAEAAPGTTAWLLGGNSGVSTDGSNFLGPTTAGAPLIFKTRASGATSNAERMRILANGNVGIGVTTPTAKLQVKTGGTAIQASSTSTAASSATISASAAAGAGVVGSSTSGAGVKGTSTNDYGVVGSGKTGGVLGQTGYYGVVGLGDSVGGYFGGTTGLLAGGSGAANGLIASGRIGVYAQAAVSGQAQALLAEGGQYAVYGTGGGTAGVRGDSGYVGVWGQGTSWGLYGVGTATTGQNYGVYATTSSPDGFAVFAQGRVHVNGTLSKSAGSFKIDHPLDPDNKWLLHSFVESPDMMNVYNGIVTTDADGHATVDLPDYFDALNRDPRYQLTVIGQFAQAIVSRKVSGNSFEIRTDHGNVEVSWQVTGIRQDAYATAHPIQVEEDKTDEDKAASGSSGQRRGVSADPRAPRSVDVEIPAADSVPQAPKLP
ncbi:hypothetical protein QM517_07235 [Rhodococcus sp. IEGM 1404]|nr:hypothetical protein [Microbacterium sp. IEGM 1404]